MKKFISILLLISICALLFSCSTSSADIPTTEPKSPDIWNKGYSIVFNAYTSHSGHPTDEVHYCLTDQNTLVYAAANWDIKLEPWEFDQAAFTALCTDYGRWQSKFTPQYICRYIDRAWKGSSSEGFDLYLLRMRDGMLMVAIGVDYLTSVHILEERGTQAEYFSYWNKKWVPRQFETNTEPYQTWKVLYNRYK